MKRKLPYKERRRRDEVRRQVFNRDKHRCKLRGVEGAGLCYGPLTFHHRKKASQGGDYSVGNGVTLCALHNDQLEADADLAALGHDLGLVVYSWETVEEM